MSRKARFALPLLLLIPACTKGASEPMLTGDELGRYQVQASLVSNECGEGHPAPPTLSFVVDLGHLPGSTRGYWKLPDGPEIDGTLERSAGFRFEQASEFVVTPADMALGIPGCLIERREIVTGTLEAAAVEGLDGGASDAGSDAGTDAGSDAGPTDAGPTDAVPNDGGSNDAGMAADAGLDRLDAAAPMTMDNESALSGTTRVRISAVPGGDCTALLAVYGGPFPTVPCDLVYELSGVRVGATP